MQSIPRDSWLPPVIGSAAALAAIMSLVGGQESRVLGYVVMGTTAEAARLLETVFLGILAWLSFTRRRIAAVAAIVYLAYVIASVWVWLFAYEFARHERPESSLLVGAMVTAVLLGCARAIWQRREAFAG